MGRVKYTTERRRAAGRQLRQPAHNTLADDSGFSATPAGNCSCDPADSCTASKQIERSPAMSKRVTMGLLAIAAAAVFALSAESQPPEGGRDKDRGPPRGQRGERGGPFRFELGRVLPPFMKDELKLTPDQEKQIADLEKDVKERLTKILTADQRKQLENMRPPRGGFGGPGGPGGDRGGPGGERRPGRPDDRPNRDNPPPPPPPDDRQ
jgi:hypothetical protein